MSCRRNGATEMGHVLQGFHPGAAGGRLLPMRVRAFILAVLGLALFPVAASASYPHVVQPGETLTSVAAVDGLSVNAIAAANGISNQSQLVAGQILWIPPRSLMTAGAGAAATTRTQTTYDPDSDSDTDPVTGAAVTGGSSEASSAATGSSSTGVQPSTAVQTQPTATTQAVSTSSQLNTAPAVAPPLPTQERVSAGQIAYIASANGVPPALAEAVAWQESGWNNDEVSGVGAVGVMQIVPNTWSWIDRYLTPSVPLGNTSAAENIRAGVLLLHQLLQLSGGNESLAVAGYFQGLASVKRNGMFPSTRQYVADVMALTQRFGG